MAQMERAYSRFKEKAHQAFLRDLATWGEMERDQKPRGEGSGLSVWFRRSLAAPLAGGSAISLEL